mgnify:CR=1 FL=1
MHVAVGFKVVGIRRKAEMKFSDTLLGTAGYDTAGNFINEAFTLSAALLTALEA